MIKKLDTYPIISIVVATFNSEKTVKMTLESIKKQSYPQDKIEILVVDGRSNDQTINIAKKYRCKIITNSKVELIYAKYLGFLKATGKYIIYLDSDEVLDNRDSLKIKYSAFRKNPQVKAVLLGGYKTPLNYPSINYYINDFGDPFSFFIYHESKNEYFMVREWSEKYPVVSNTNNFVILDLSSIKLLPQIELWAGGCMFDLKYAKKVFPNLKRNPHLIALLFYLLNKKGDFIAITKNDSTVHYSSASLNKYLKKINSRIKNNIFNTDMGKAGYSGRNQFQSLWFKLKKYLFIPYTLSFIFPLKDSIYFLLTRKKIIYCIHIPLCYYTIIMIIYYETLKLLKVAPPIKNYGG